jgi:hypothetical protein
VHQNQAAVLQLIQAAVLQPIQLAVLQLLQIAVHQPATAAVLQLLAARNAAAVSLAECSRNTTAVANQLVATLAAKHHVLQLVLLLVIQAAVLQLHQPAVLQHQLAAND